jgi:hypothetical protein
MGRYSPELGSDCRVTPHLGASYRTGQKENLPAIGCASLSPNQENGLSIRNGVLLCKQLFRPMMDYACPIWRCAARSYVKQLQALQFKCLRIATGAPWYISSTQIHEYLGVPFFAEHTRALTDSYVSKLAGVGNPLVRQLGRYLRWPRADASCRMRKLRDQPTSRGRMQNGGQVDVETCSLFTSWAHFGHPDWGFTLIFLSRKVNARVKVKKSVHGPRNAPLLAGTTGSPKCPLRKHYAIRHPVFNPQAAIQPKFSPLR